MPHCTRLRYRDEGGFAVRFWAHHGHHHGLREWRHAYRAHPRGLHLAARSLGLGLGRLLSHRVHDEDLDGARYSFTAAAERVIVKGVKEKLRYIALGFDTEMKDAIESSDKVPAALVSLTLLGAFAGRAISKVDSKGRRCLTATSEGAMSTLMAGYAYMAVLVAHLPFVLHRVP